MYTAYHKRFICVICISYGHTWVDKQFSLFYIEDLYTRDYAKQKLYCTSYRNTI